MEMVKQKWAWKEEREGRRKEMGVLEIISVVKTKKEARASVVLGVGKGMLLVIKKNQSLTSEPLHLSHWQEQICF